MLIMRCHFRCEYSQLNIIELLYSIYMCSWRRLSHQVHTDDLSHHASKRGPLLASENAILDMATLALNFSAGLEVNTSAVTKLR